VRHVPSGLELTARVHSQEGVVARQQQQQVARALRVAASIPPSPFVPPAAASFRDWPAAGVQLAGELLASGGALSLQQLMLACGPFSQE
jgi:hypothetical protein